MNNATVKHYYVWWGPVDARMALESYIGGEECHDSVESAKEEITKSFIEAQNERLPDEEPSEAVIYEIEVICKPIKRIKPTVVLKEIK